MYTFRRNFAVIETSTRIFVFFSQQMGEISIIADLNSLYFNLFPPTFKQFFSISNFISLFEEKKKEKIATPSPLLRILRVHGSRCREQAGNRNNARKIYAAGAKREIPPNIYIYRAVWRLVNGTIDVPFSRSSFAPDGA